MRLLLTDAELLLQPGHRKDPQESDGDHHAGDDQRLDDQVAQIAGHVLGERADLQADEGESRAGDQQFDYLPGGSGHQARLGRLRIGVPAQRQGEGDDCEHSAAIGRVGCNVGDDGHHQDQRGAGRMPG